MTFIRSGARAADQLRPVRITRGFTIHAEGSVLVAFGNTKVLCTASVEEKVPPHKRGSGEGWVTAEWKKSESNQRAKFYKITKLGKEQLASDYERWGKMVATIEGIMTAK